MQNRRTAEGFIAAIAMVILALVLIYINSRIIGARKQFTTVSGKGTKRNLASLGKWRYPVAIAVIVFLLSASVLPMGLLLYQSLMARMGDYSLSNLTLHYWIGTDPTVREGHIGLLVNPRVWTAAKNTLMLGTLTGIGSALLGILLGYAISRGRGTKLALSLDQLSFLPFLIPDIAFGAIYLTMSARPMGPIPPLYGTFALLVLVSTVSRLPNATRSGTSSMMQVSMELEEAAYVHGSSWFNTFRRIMLPLTKNGFMAGFVLTFIGTMTALSLIILLYTPSTVILPVLTFEYANRELRQLSDGMSLLITLLVIVGTYVARKLTGTDLSQGFGGGN
jgi:iron(III) transport system permease protein